MSKQTLYAQKKLKIGTCLILVSVVVDKNLSGRTCEFYINLKMHIDRSEFEIVPETKIAEFANSVDLDEVAHNEPPHLDLHCWPCSL